MYFGVCGIGFWLGFAFSVCSILGGILASSFKLVCCEHSKLLEEPAFLFAIWGYDSSVIALIIFCVKNRLEVLPGKFKLVSYPVQFP